MADDMTDPNVPVADAPEAEARDGAGRSVHIPPWLAAALVVVLGLAIGGAGFAIGRATADDNGQLTPVVNRLPGGHGGPGAGRGLPGFPGFPGLPHFPGGLRLPGGDREPGGRYPDDRGPGNRDPEGRGEWPGPQGEPSPTTSTPPGT